MFDVPEEGHTPEQREDIEMVEVRKEGYVHDEIDPLIIEPKAQAETIILYKFGVLIKYIIVDSSNTQSFS